MCAIIIFIISVDRMKEADWLKNYVTWKISQFICQVTWKINSDICQVKSHLENKL